MFCGVVIGSNDIERSKRFYDAITSVVGCEPPKRDKRGSLLYYKERVVFMVTDPLDGKLATVANGGVVGFAMSTPEQVDEWYSVGMANGGACFDDPPGVRVYPTEKNYVAYLRDPDGNKIGALCPLPMDS